LNPDAESSAVRRFGIRPLADAPEAFRRFDRREDGYIKVVLDLGTGRP
jgi:threonine dehydrogenase-like Zn-dependent dehydrogenase